MSQETSLTEVRTEIREMRAQMAKEHSELRDKVIEVDKQMHTLHVHQRVMMWLGAPICLAVGAALREIIGKWFS